MQGKPILNEIEKKKLQLTQDRKKKILIINKVISQILTNLHFTNKREKKRKIVHINRTKCTRSLFQ